MIDPVTLYFPIRISRNVLFNKAAQRTACFIYKKVKRKIYEKTVCPQNISWHDYMKNIVEIGARVCKDDCVR